MHRKTNVTSILPPETLAGVARVSMLLPSGATADEELDELAAFQLMTDLAAALTRRAAARRTAGMPEPPPCPQCGTGALPSSCFRPGCPRA